MQKYFLDNKSDKLILFFTGWGCDENQFVNLTTKNDLLLLYDYQNLDLDFDFSKYKEIYTISYSAGVFISSILEKNISNTKQKVAICGNPYLFDENIGLTREIIKEFRNINLNNYLQFRRKYMVETEEEFEKYNKLQSQRSIESCMSELKALEEIYIQEKNNINPYFDKVILAENDLIFKLQTQKEFYKDNIKTVPKAKHHIFFKFKTYNEILDF
ncbi:DUF452 family protein [bacterium]|nr:DUF452 family protein [bacterium]